MGSAIDHKGDIYDALIGTGYPLTSLNPAVDLQTMTESIASAIDGIVPKDNVDAATTGALPANTRTVDVLTADANGAFPTIDGVSPALDQAYLVKNEGGVASHINNGIYTLTVVGDGVTPWELTRRSDLDDGDSAAGAFLHVEQGTVNGEATFRCKNNEGTDVVNTDALEWIYWGQTVNHANLLNKQWSVAGHTIDTNVDMAGYKLTDNFHFGAYHISDTHGDDTNGDGSPGNPTKTINQALSLWRTSGEPHGSFVIDVQSGTTYVADLQAGDDVSFTAIDGIWSNQVAEIEITLADSTTVTINNLTIQSIREGSGQTGTSDVFIEDGWLGRIRDYAQTGYATHTNVSLANTWINNPTTLTELANCAGLYVGSAFGDSTNLVYLFGDGLEMMNGGINLNDYSIFHSDGSLRLSAGAYYDGTQWVAGATEATVINISRSGDFQLCYDSSLTPGSPFSPTVIFATDDAGNIITVGTVDGVDISAHASDVDAHHNEDHASRHSDGGADEIDIADLGSTSAGGADEVPLSDGAGGVSWTAGSPPSAHASSHENGGSDEISVDGLSGVLADDQHIIDTEAVSAMGVKADGNPLNHDRYTDGEAQSAVKHQDDVSLAGVTPVDADVSAWTNGDRGIGIGTGGRIFLMYKYSGAVKYVELS